MSHHHLTRDERVTLAALLRAGETHAACARILGVHRSTIAREVRRSPKEYKVFMANKNALNRRKESKQLKRKIENNKKLEKKIVKLLRIGRSPEQISEDVKQVSDETIYAWVERSRKDLAVLLPQRGRKRHVYGKKPTEVQGWTKLVRSIETRPKVAETRSRVGDWEGDTITGRDRARLLVHVDRRSRFIVANVMPNGGADITHATTVLSLSKFPRHTITYDRGSEFSLWRIIENDTGAKVYFAHAHHPWERGTSENSNGLLRRFFPKGTPLGEKLQKEIDKAVWLINHRPRKCLQWKTPCQVFGYCCNSD